MKQIVASNAAQVKLCLKLVSGPFSLASGMALGNVAMLVCKSAQHFDPDGNISTVFGLKCCSDIHGPRG